MLTSANNILTYLYNSILVYTSSILTMLTFTNGIIIIIHITIT